MHLDVTTLQDYQLIFRWRLKYGGIFNLKLNDVCQFRRCQNSKKCMITKCLNQKGYRVKCIGEIVDQKNQLLAGCLSYGQTFFKKFAHTCDEQMLKILRRYIDSCLS